MVVFFFALIGLDIDGLYRVSGNLATIQKLRYKVDHGRTGFFGLFYHFIALLGLV